MSELRLTARRTLSPVSVLAVVTMLLTSVALALLLTGSPGESASVLAADGDDDADATEAVADDDADAVVDLAALAVAQIEVSLVRDPFDPVRPEDVTTTSTGTSDPADPADPADPTDPDNGQNASEGTRIRAVEVRSDSAVIEVGATRYDVEVGESFAGTYRLLRIVQDCAEVQRGDQVLPLLCVGDELFK